MKLSTNIKQLELDGIESALSHQLSIDMSYTASQNKVQTGKSRTQCTLKYCARFGLVSPSLIRLLYSISQSMALEHLNKLVKAELLRLVTTHRVSDGRVYVLTHAGAKFAESLLQQYVPFRSTAEPSQQINQNTVMHDVILQYTFALGLKQSKNRNQDWLGIVSEREFKRLYPDNSVRSVDALVCEPNGMLAALEMEHSFKNLATRKTILQRYAQALRDEIYQKIFLVSHCEKILNDIKRLNIMATHSLLASKKKTDIEFSEDDAKRLESAIIYRTKFCEPLTKKFYR